MSVRRFATTTATPGSDFPRLTLRRPRQRTATSKPITKTSRLPVHRAATSSPVSLDDHRYRTGRAVTVSGQELQQLVTTGRVATDAGFDEQGADIDDESDALVARPSRHRTTWPNCPPRSACPCRSPAHTRHAAPSPKDPPVHHLSNRSRHQRTPGSPVCRQSSRTHGHNERPAEADPPVTVDTGKQSSEADDSRPRPDPAEATLKGAAPQHQARA